MNKIFHVCIPLKPTQRSKPSEGQKAIFVVIIIIPECRIHVFLMEYEQPWPYYRGYQHVFCKEVMPLCCTPIAPVCGNRFALSTNYNIFFKVKKLNGQF